MKSMMLCNTVVAILALIGTGLISAGLVLLLMSLGLPDKPVSYRWKENEKQYYELRRAMQDREWVNKQKKKGVIK